MKIIKKILQIKFLLIAVLSKIIHRLLIENKYFLMQLISLFTLKKSKVNNYVNIISVTTRTNLQKYLSISKISDLKVVCIMDTFTYNVFKPEAKFHQLSIDNWFNEIKEIKPDILFIESAWRGKDNQWEGKINNLSQEIINIIVLCRKINIITIFWNKEDPVHFETFIDTAKYFDYIFTTDEECIERYKKKISHNNVYLLPFSFQPKLHNPIEKYSRKSTISFAGAYYWRFKKRNAVLEDFIKNLMLKYHIDIYDRNYNNPTSVHQFPREYKPFIRGTLEYNEIDKAYKGHEYSINLNSITNSSTMFSRRVFELIASNTLVISNYSYGLKLLFGDLVISTNDGRELIKIMARYDKQPNIKRKIKLLALRTVLMSHTAENRWTYIINKISAETPRKTLPHVTILNYIKSKKELENILKIFNRQSYENIDMIVMYSKGVTIDHNTYTHIKFMEDTSTDLLKSYINDKKGYISVISSNDYYGENYILDLILARKYSNANIIGKNTYYQVNKDNKLNLENSNFEYKYVNNMESNMCIIKNSKFIELDIIHDCNTLISSEYEEEILSIDAFNYCKNGNKFILDESNMKVINDLKDIDTGTGLNTLLDNDA